MTASNGNGQHPRPTDLPAWVGPTAQVREAAVAIGNSRHGAHHAAASADPAGSAGPIDFVAQRELRDRVSTRLTADGGAAFEALDAATQRMRKRTVAMEELQSWVLHRTSLGLPAPSLESEDALIESVLASLGGLGRLEPLLLRPGVEDIFFNGAHSTMLRMADGRKVPAEPIANSGDELHVLLQQLASTLGDGTSREISDARPLLALRMKSVGDLGARLSAAMDVTPHPVGTIRIHRHSEDNLDDVYERRRMIDAPLRAFLRAAVLAGLKIGIVGAMGHGKTFLLRALCSEIPLDQAIITVEDERELGLHVLPAHDAHGQIIYAPDGSVVPRRHPALVVECSADSIAHGEVGGVLVVAAAQVLHERVTGRDGAQRADRLDAAHRPQPCFEPAVVSLDAVVRVLLGDVSRSRRELLDHAWVDRCSIGGDFDRSRGDAQRACRLV